MFRNSIMKAMLRREIKRSGSIRMITLDFKQPNFRIPKTDRQLKLKEINAHPKDKLIEFEPESHVYTMDNQPIKKSVTQLVEQFFHKFDPDAAITAMQNGPNWPRPEYTWKGEALTAEQIKTRWENMGIYARNRGTWMHHNIETHLNGGEIEGPLDPTMIAEMNQFYDFEKNELIPNKITPYRTEWAIGSASLQLAGTVDFIGKLPNGKYIIIDWKRSPKLPNSMTNTWRNAKPPLSHLHDCDGMKYSLQLNVYKHLLQLEYDIDVAKMVLVSFHPKLQSYFAVEVKHMGNEVKSILKSDS